MDHYLEHTGSFGAQLSLENAVIFNAKSRLAGSRPDSIIVVGMGGSGLAGNLLRKLSGELGLKVPVFSHKDYGVPRTAYRNPLYVFISVSGNTKETLSGLVELLPKRKRVPIVLVTGGGEMEEIGKRFLLPMALFKNGDLTPRESLGYTYYSLIKVLLLYFPGLRLSDLNRNIKPSKLENYGRSLASSIRGYIPLFYAEPDIAHVGYVFKTTVNETAKYPAFAHLFPEMNHNEIVSFEKSSFPFLAVFLTTKDTSAEITKRIRINRHILGKRGVKTEVVRIPGRSLSEQTWNGVIIAHFSAAYLAIARKVKPTETKLIDELKKLTK